MNLENQFIDVPVLSDVLQAADHVDVKYFEGDTDLRSFLAGMFAYYPGWLKALYGIRWAFVRVLGMKQDGMPPTLSVQPQDIKMMPGDKAAIFEVEAAREDAYYVASAAERHLTAYLAVVMEPISDSAIGNQNRFAVVTVVHYSHWTGPIYFNVIRPFHHLVVRAMGNAGIQARFGAAV